MAVERWRQFAEKYGRPHVRVVSPKLAANIHARFEQMRSLWPDITDDERICRLLKAVSGSEFLLGHTDRWGGATLDWIMLPSNFSKIVNGNYVGAAQPLPGLQLGFRDPSKLC